MTIIVVVLDGVINIASAIICSWSYGGSKVEIECLPTSIAGSEATVIGALQHIATSIPEITNYYIPAITRASTGEVYLELVKKETSLGYLEALPLTHIDIKSTCAKPGATSPFSLGYF